MHYPHSKEVTTVMLSADFFYIDTYYDVFKTGQEISIFLKPSNLLLKKIYSLKNDYIMKHFFKDQFFESSVLILLFYKNCAHKD